MKKHKYKSITFKTARSHTKLIFQWVRGGDVEITLHVLKGPMYMSGLFAIEDTKADALIKLREICAERHAGVFIPDIPWDALIAKYARLGK